MTVKDQIKQFLIVEHYGVAGASADREKLGNKLLRCYMQHGRTVIPVNPRAESIEGLACVEEVADLPFSVQSLSVVTPPAITVEVVKQALANGFRKIWMQPGAGNPDAIELCRQAQVNCIYGGPCLLVELGCSGTH